jgi:preprotein translocase subunit YajC
MKPYKRRDMPDSRKIKLAEELEIGDHIKVVSGWIGTIVRITHPRGQIHLRTKVKVDGGPFLYLGTILPKEMHIEVLP